MRLVHLGAAPHIGPQPLCAAVEAMRLYVRTLEEELPEWWAQHTGTAADTNGTEGGEAPAANGVAAAAGAAQQAGGAQPPAAPAPKSRSVAEVVVEGSWVSPYISSDKRPPPRYEHATALVGSELFIIGGNYGGWRGHFEGQLRWVARPFWRMSGCAWRAGRQQLLADVQCGGRGCWVVRVLQRPAPTCLPTLARRALPE